jgi:hypothetical protein
MSKVALPFEHGRTEKKLVLEQDLQGKGGLRLFGGF